MSEYFELYDDQIFNRVNNNANHNDINKEKHY